MVDPLWPLMAGFLCGLTVGLFIARHALLTAIDGMSEDKAIERAWEIIEECDDDAALKARKTDNG